jgi:hypothetical protein
LTYDRTRVLSTYERRRRAPKNDLLQGTLDLLILKTLALGPNHGWGISNRIRQASGEGLDASHGSLPGAPPTRAERRRHV